MIPDSPLFPAPSEWVVRCAPLIRANGRVLDVACGSGRHVRFLTRAGFQVEAVDRDASALAVCANWPGAVVRRADLENEMWPYGAGEFDGIVVANYLHRPLFPKLLESLAMGGILIYETFAEGHEQFGRPRNPDYLLKSAELLEQVRDTLEVNAYEELCVIKPKYAVMQRICATRVTG